MMHALKTPIDSGAFSEMFTDGIHRVNFSGNAGNPTKRELVLLRRWLIRVAAGFGSVAVSDKFATAATVYYNTTSGQQLAKKRVSSVWNELRSLLPEAFHNVRAFESTPDRNYVKVIVTELGNGAVPNPTSPAGLFSTGDPRRAEFREMVSAWNLRYFTAEELLSLGASNDIPGNKCYRKNKLPPREKWSNIRNTAKMLDEIRRRVGEPISITSAYRSQSYNDCVGGVKNSMHRAFNAIDFKSNRASPATLWRVSNEVRESDTRFTGGIGRYRSFVHIDTRGQRRDWDRR